MKELLQRLAGLPASKRLLFARRNPLSFAQERLWFLDRLHGGSAFYNGTLAVELEGDLDLPAMAASLSEIVRRHQVLRTAFLELDGLPLQVAAPAGPLPLPLVDLSEVATERRVEALAALTGEASSRPFDLAAPPLVRALAVRESARRHTLLLTLHHIAADRWSLLVYAGELATLYGANACRRPSPLPELPLQYSDFALWQRRALQGERLAAGIAYWRRQLEGAPTVLELPTDRPRPPVETFRGGRARRAFRAGLGRELAAFAARREATGFMVLLAAFSVLLQRYGGQEDLLLGSSIDHRDRVELEGLIGIFVETLVLRTRPSRSLPFHLFLESVRRTVLAAYEHLGVPFEKLVEALRPERALSRNPLFQVELNVVEMPAAALDLPGLAATARPISRDTAVYDLVLTLEERQGSFEGVLDYNSDLYDAATAARLLTHFERLLTGILDDDGQPLGRLPLLPEVERHHLLAERLPAPPPSGRPAEGLQRVFEARVELHSETVAAVCGGRSVSYGALNRQANRLAHWLRTGGVGLESRVAVLGERGLDLLATILGLAKAGAVYVPLEPGNPDPRLAAILADCEPVLLITQASLAERALALAAGLPEPPRVLCWDGAPDGLGLPDRRELEAQPDGDPPEGADPRALANIFYTSGSTGRPKGAMIEHRGMLNHLWAKVELLGLGAGSVVAQNASPGFDISVWQFLAALLAGGRVVIYDDAAVQADSFLARVERDGVTVLETVPTLLDLMLAGAPAEVGLPHLAHLISNAETLPVPLCHRWHERFPHVPLLNTYGATECSDDVTHQVFRTPPPAAAQRVGVGRAIPEMGAFVLDRELGPVPLGCPGQLAFSGTGVGRGYLGDPVKTAGVFVPAPFEGAPGGRLYLTGDLGRITAEGTLEFLGRIDHQVKLRGLRVELGEVEAALCRHPAVRECVVVVRHDGPGEGRLVAYTVCERGAGPPAEELRAFLRSRLPEPMLPSAFVALDALPLTANGKVDRRALPAPAAEPEEPEAGFVPPRGPVEEMAAAVWSEVLGRERVGAHDDFFELGGHSLLAMRVMSRVRAAFGLEVPLRALFESPELAGFAIAIERAMRAEGSAEAPPIEPGSHTGPLPLSFGQQRLWFLSRLEPGSPAYNLPLAVRYRGLDVAVFAASLTEVVRRHSALRTVFVEIEGEPEQVVLPAAPVPLPVVDLGALPEGQRLTEARRLAAAEALRPFDLARGPLLRCLVLLLAAEDCVAITTMHHVASDGWSMEVFRGELAALHAALRRGAPSPLLDLPVQYADYAVWQRRWLSGEVLAAEIAYWRQRLAGLPPVLELPADRPRPATRTSLGGSRRLTLAPSLASGLRGLARREGATLFMTLLAALQAMLARLSGQADIAVGTPVAGRNRLETEGLIGFFVNTLVMRTDLSGDPRFLDLLARVRSTALGAYAHQELPFERLVEALAPERSLSHSPLFQVMLALENVPRRAAEDDAALAASPFELEGGIAKFDLVFGFSERAGEVAGGVTYSADLFDEITAERWLRHLTTLLEGAAAEPERCLAALPLLTPAERWQLREWSGGEAIGACGRCLHELFASQAARTPDAVAAVGGEEALSYRELFGRATRLAHRLSGLGVAPEVRVGLCVERSLDMLAGLLGILMAGGAYVPLDPDYPRERLAFTLVDSAAPILVTQTRLLPILPQSPLIDGVKILCLDTLGEDADGETALPPASGAVPANLAYVIYTSGSTGRPKGVGICHASAAALVRWAQRLHTSEELAGVLASTSICFDLSVFEIFLPLCTGGSIILARNALELPALPAAGRVTLVNTVPSAIAELVRANALPPSVRIVDLAGEPLSRALVDQIFRCSEVRHVFNLYGPSEDTTYSTFTEVPRGSGSAPTIGRPVGDGRAMVLDGTMEPVPVGVPGELCLGGVGLARCYLNRPELTAVSFVPDPFAEAPGSRLYRTGDLARYRLDGELEFLGRIDHQVKIRGFRIEPGEVEAVLAGLPAVRDVAVLAREDEPGDRRLVAYIVPAAENLDVPALRRALAERLPGFMVPSAFVVLAALPLTPNGKLDRRALPAPHQTAGGEGVAPPRTAVEEIVAGMWQEVLKVPSVGRHDDFFSLGGHSLLATRVASRVREAFGVDLPLRRLFENPTVAGLAGDVETALHADGAGSAASPAIERLEEPGGRSLSFAQQRLWFMDQLDPGNPAYNLAAALRLTGPLDAAALARSFAEVVRRHEVLRTTFAARDGRPVQTVLPYLAVDLPLLDLSTLSGASREAAIRSCALEEARRSFALDRGPLLRVTLLRLAPSEHALIVVLHHIVADAWSLGVLLRDLDSAYSALAQGRSLPVNELPVQYADFAAWQRRCLSGEPLEAHLAYWRRRLAGLDVLELPTDRPRPAANPHRGALLSRRIAPELSSELKQLARRESVTLFMVLLAGFQILLHSATGEDDVAVGADIANRNRAETEALIGFFVNMLVLRTDLSRNPTVRQMLGRVREVALGAFAHQDLPFDKLVEHLQPERLEGRAPFFRVVLNFNNTMDAGPAGGLGRIGELTLAPIEIEQTMVRFELALLMREEAGGLAASWLYSTDLFDGAAIERLHRRLESVLAAMAADPEARLSALRSALLGERTGRQVQKTLRQAKPVPVRL
jgi:amino acid adenylation domain-containing protein